MHACIAWEQPAAPGSQQGKAIEAPCCLLTVRSWAATMRTDWMLMLPRLDRLMNSRPITLTTEVKGAPAATCGPERRIIETGRSVLDGRCVLRLESSGAPHLPAGQAAQ